MEISEQVLKGVGKHFVSLSCIQRDANSREVAVLVFSGFVIRVSGVWIFVSAGHILETIRSVTEAGHSFDVWRLGDQTGNRRFGDSTIPFDFDIGDWLVLDDDSRGLDYAAVVLRPLFQEALAEGGIVPLSESTWGNPWSDDYERRFAVGIPEESVRRSGESTIKCGFAIAPMRRAELPPDGFVKRENQFYSKLDDDPSAVIKDLKGMSGSPVFSCKIENGQLYYRLLGVQSAWYRSLRIVAACSIASFGMAVKQALDDVSALDQTVDGESES